MKRSFPGIISLLCLFIALAAVIYSCRKQDLGDSSATDRLVESAIDWHDGHTATPSTLSNKKKARKLRPDWDNAYVEKNERGTRFLVVPAPDYSIKNKDVRGFRRFVFTERNGEITGGEIVEFFGDPSFISSHKKDLPARKDDQEIKGYDGVVIHYDVNYRYRSGSMFKNGKKQKGAVQIRSGSQATLKKMAKGNKTADYTDPQPGCEYYFLVWYDTYTYELIYWVYLGEWCPDDGENPYGNEGGDGGGGGGGGGGEGPLPDGVCLSCDPNPSYNENAQILENLLDNDPDFRSAYNRMNPSEKLLALQHPLDAYEVYINSKQAELTAKEAYPNSRDLHNDTADAFRHAFWNGLNALDIGFNLAKGFGNAHEEIPINNIEDGLEKQMDLHNNQVGRDAALFLYNQGTYSEENLKNYLIDRGANGGLWIIENNQIVVSH